MWLARQWQLPWQMGFLADEDCVRARARRADRGDGVGRRQILVLRFLACGETMRAGAQN